MQLAFSMFARIPILSRNRFGVSQHQDYAVAEIIPAHMQGVCKVPLLNFPMFLLAFSLQPAKVPLITVLPSSFSSQFCVIPNLVKDVTHASVLCKTLNSIRQQYLPQQMLLAAEHGSNSASTSIFHVLMLYTEWLLAALTTWVFCSQWPSLVLYIPEITMSQ